MCIYAVDQLQCRIYCVPENLVPVDTLISCPSTPKKQNHCFVNLVGHILDRRASRDRFGEAAPNLGKFTYNFFLLILSLFLLK